MSIPENMRTNGDSERSAQDERLTRLEEHAAFSEHTVEQLSQEIVELNRRLSEAVRRIALLESRLGGAIEAIESAQRNDSAGGTA